MAKRSKRKKEKKIKFKESPKEVIIKTKTDWLKKALVNKKKYEKNYNNSIKNNDAFWKKEGKRITWIKPYKKIKNIKYSSILYSISNSNVICVYSYNRCRSS